MRGAISGQINQCAVGISNRSYKIETKSCAEPPSKDTNRGILEEFFLFFDLVWTVKMKYDLDKLKKGFWRKCFWHENGKEWTEEGEGTGARTIRLIWRGVVY
jgi:hypothetical protein